MLQNISKIGMLLFTCLPVEPTVVLTEDVPVEPNVAKQGRSTGKLFFVS